MAQQRGGEGATDASVQQVADGDLSSSAAPFVLSFPLIYDEDIWMSLKSCVFFYLSFPVSSSWSRTFLCA